MWESVVNQLDARKQLGPSIPIRCHNHHSQVTWIQEPGQIELVAPDGMPLSSLARRSNVNLNRAAFPVLFACPIGSAGGCLRPCGFKLDCGHVCSSCCHADSHAAVQCRRNCSKLLPACGHPCLNVCSDPCGPCSIPVSDVKLPCGHVVSSVSWSVSHRSAKHARFPVPLLHETNEKLFASRCHYDGPRPS